jgi:transcriptional regulator with XRE-family HTH domain
MDWREFLSTLINNPAERDRIATEIGVHSVTLSRWVSGESSPRPHNLRQLLRALPKQQRNQLQALLEKVSPDVSDFEIDTSEQEIPYKFIMEVLEARASIPDLLRFWSITRLVLQQALRQLDPERVGLAITVVRCMPMRGDKIRSLRESVGLGTPPWGGDLEEKALLLGAESLAGHVTVSCRLEHIGDLQANKTFLPAYQVEHEVSAVACPIMHACRVAGCLLLSSTQLDYFAPEARLSLVRGYTNLVSLAFNPDEFYDPDKISLHIMPPPDTQQEYFAGFRQRVLHRMQASATKGGRLASNEAEQEEWQDIEEKLLSLSNELRTSR